METQGGEGGFELVGDLGDKILLGLIESDLTAPEVMDDINADQKEREEEGRTTGPYFCANSPSRRWLRTNQMIQEATSPTQRIWMAIIIISGV